MAKKKIYDIVPPGVAHKVQNTLKSLESAAAHKKGSRSKAVVAKKTAAQAARRFPWIEIAVGGGVVMLLLGFYLYKALPRAEINISPALDTISLQEKVVFSTSAQEIQTAQKVIPARLVEVTQEISQQFPATGSASNDGKAAGTITIYNNFSPAAPISLKVGTHFLSDSGKYFVTLSKVTIPAMKGKTPGSITVRVEAEESGDSHNIGPSKFSVPKLAGTAYYYSIWGESKDAMSGGYAGNVKKVTTDDIESAKSTLAKQLFADAEQALRESIGADEVLLDGALQTKTQESKTDLLAGSVAENFTATASVKASALVFKKADVREFSQHSVMLKISEDKVILEPSLVMEYTPDTIDVDKGQGTMNLRISTKTHHNIDTAGLVGWLTRKPASEAERMVRNQYGQTVSGVQVDLWPFWVKKVPANENKVNVNLHFE